ncbi:bifunctional riboflavin kinase/FAD synthetase [Bacillus suaedae]|uniref:Riboflavin biosynthesis protein n=1 Tax=Halalkalibacter suaedae TaxID=2822140 RepID=A0A940WWP3_9BACI|nr:bifunctional riboflavin kinase/FAD synthetase [Bacillus suaedae]MBP3951992.1 bifunctional riboflavin kinase/FAD synthetase [Bacillus suaedae]
MDTIYLHHPIDTNNLQHKPTVMALGFFDGVHKGHQAVFNTARDLANQGNYHAAAMTFHPHPKEVLRPSNSQMKYITPLKEKIKKIEELGIETLYVIEFSLEFAKLTPQQFVDDYLITLGVVHVVAGYDFTYGALGKGTMETLPLHARDRLKITTVTKYEENDEKVSSTRIRNLLDKGEVEQVSQLLNRPYSITGKVVDGEKRGRTIGFPTANISLTDHYLIPSTGVYAVNALIHNQQHHGVCNIGFKPTFHDAVTEPTIEVHLFNFNEEIYGQSIEVEWIIRLRSEMKFNGIDELVEQIKADKDAALRHFNK